MDNDTKAIVSVEVVDKRETQRKSAWTEKVAFQKVEKMEAARVFVKEVCTDAHPQISALMPKLQAKISRKSVATSGGCVQWTGARCWRGYGQVKVTEADGGDGGVSPRRLAYFLNSDLPFLQKHKHVSHLCNDKLCVNAAHLSYEENVVNQPKKNCFEHDRCTGHRGYPKCLTKR
ncbi:Hypp6110 [Branchiostoma lanceolatum]|uniref:Hypp6110 protein n=1 Tax=Branchiostoma lanceolatum TaxID=7740 RepID=A0A8J9WHX4_BRALA|nr:Hypp6110 [Branchiostoma lanceolatum]